MYGEAGYSGHNTDDAINFGGANVWVRSEPEMLQRMEIPISDGVDDVELLDNGRVYTGSGDIEMTFGQYPNEHHEKVGLAFRSIGLKQGIQVAHAEIQFTATASDNELVELEISAVAVDSFVDWETHGTSMPLGNGDPSRDPTTGRDSSGDAILMTDPPFGINDVTDAVTWLPRPWSKGQSGRAQATTELKDVINAIVGRPNWREGNDMGFIIAHTCPTTGYGSTCTSVQMGADSASNQRLCEAEPGCLYAGLSMNGDGGVGFRPEYDHGAPTLVESCSCLNGRRTATSFNRNQEEAAKLVVYHSPTGYTNPCGTNPCQNGGTCVPSKYAVAYTCSCPSIDIVGFHCEVQMDLMQYPARADQPAIGPGWVLVRRVQQGMSWHPADDQLRGTDVYGTYPADLRNADQAPATFSVPFADIDFNQFLFESGDRSQWLIMDRKEIEDCDAIVASGIDRPWQPWHPSVRVSSATVDGSCEACSPAGAGWTRVFQGSVPGSNIHLWGPSACGSESATRTCVPEGVSLEECKAHCDEDPTCAAFEFGVAYGGSQTAYQEGDCQPQSSADPINYLSDDWNLDLYVKGSNDELSAGSGYAVQQYCRPTAREDPWISVAEHPADIVYGEGAYQGHNTDDAISHGGANVWVRKLPTCAIGHTPKTGDDGQWVPTGNTEEPYQCVPDGNFVVQRSAYGAHDHLESFEDVNSPIGAGWYLVRRTHTAQWHQATDALSGTAIYGTFDPSGTSRRTFSIPFVEYDYDQFLFASGDMTMWMIMNKGALMDCQSIKASAIDLPWNPVIQHSNFEVECNAQNTDEHGCTDLPFCEWVPSHADEHQQCVGVSCNTDDRTVNCALKASDHSWNGMLGAEQYCRATCCPEDPVISASDHPKEVCYSEAGTNANRFVWVHEEMDWHSAQENCMSIGMTLATILNEQDQTAVMEASQGNGGWVGLTDDDHNNAPAIIACPGAPGCDASVSTHEGEWVFTDGSVVGDMNWETDRVWTQEPGAFSNWAAGEPNEGTGGEDCAYLKGEGSSTQCQLGQGTGCWNDSEYKAFAINLHTRPFASCWWHWLRASR